MATKKIQILDSELFELISKYIQVGEMTWVTLSGDSWENEDGNIYSQQVEVENITKNSKIDIQVDVNDVVNNIGITGYNLYAENNNGLVKVYCYDVAESGDPIYEDLDVQLCITTIKKSSPDDVILGNTCVI